MNSIYSINECSPPSTRLSKEKKQVKKNMKKNIKRQEEQTKRKLNNTFNRKFTSATISIKIMKLIAFCLALCNIIYIKSHWSVYRDGYCIDSIIRKYRKSMTLCIFNDEIKFYLV